MTLYKQLILNTNIINNDILFIYISLLYRDFLSFNNLYLIPCFSNISFFISIEVFINSGSSKINLAIVIPYTYSPVPSIIFLLNINSLPFISTDK